MGELDLDRDLLLTRCRSRHEQIYRFHRPELEGLRLRFGFPEVVYEELSLVD